MDNHYKIIGGDEVEYGPVSLEELREWVIDGRVAGTTRIWRSDLGDWATAANYAELQDDLGRQIRHHPNSASANTVPAGFFARLAAYILDQFLISILFLLIWTPLAASRHWQLPPLPKDFSVTAWQLYRDQLAPWSSIMLPIFYPLFFIYDVLLNGRFGATVGKMAIGARITLKDGSPIGYGRAAWRWVAAQVSYSLFFAGYLLIAIRADKRGLHDLLVGTKVEIKR